MTSKMEKIDKEGRKVKKNAGNKTIRSFLSVELVRVVFQEHAWV